MQGRLITLFGGGGFIGRYVAQHLLAAGARVRVAQRNIQNAQHIKPLGNLGQVQFMAADIRKPDSVARAVQGADGVVNLVGLLKGDFQAFHVEGAANIARAAAAAGCAALVQISSIGADPGAPSRYGRSKGDGEVAVLREFPGATILRPSIVFAREDQFVNRFAGLIALSPVIPVLGGKARFQPVFAGDVAAAVAACIADPEAHAAKTYELGGPDIISMAELNAMIARETGRNTVFVDVPDMVSGVLASATGWLPGAPITRDQWLMLQKDNVVGEGMAGLADLGIAATPMAAVVPDYLVRYRKHGRFTKKPSRA
ncbi:MAG: complex I NDUFA9 subunit family protein [Blastomonas sp.]